MADLSTWCAYCHKHGDHDTNGHPNPTVAEARKRLADEGELALEVAKRAQRNPEGGGRQWDDNAKGGRGAFVRTPTEPFQPTLARLQDDVAASVLYGMSALTHRDVIKYDGWLLANHIERLYASWGEALRKALPSASGLAAQRMAATADALDEAHTRLADAQQAVREAQQREQAVERQRFYRDEKRERKLTLMTYLNVDLLDIADNLGVPTEGIKRSDLAEAIFKAAQAQGFPEAVLAELSDARDHVRRGEVRKAWRATQTAIGRWPSPDDRMRPAAA